LFSAIAIEDLYEVKARVDRVKGVFVESGCPHRHRDEKAWARGGRDSVPTPQDAGFLTTSSAHFPENER